MSRVKRHKLKKGMVRHVPKQKRISKQMIWTIIIGGLMVASVFGIMFSSYNSGKEQTTFGDYKFQRTQTGWSTKIQGKNAYFVYLPSDVEGMNISQEAVSKLRQSKVIYITFNPSAKNVQNLELLRYELGNSLTHIFNTYAMPGVTNESEDYNLPIVDCGNTTALLPVVHVVDSNETKAYVEDGCIVLETSEVGAVALTDGLLYSMLDII